MKDADTKMQPTTFNAEAALESSSSFPPFYKEAKVTVMYLRKLVTNNVFPELEKCSPHNVTVQYCNITAVTVVFRRFSLV